VGDEDGGAQSVLGRPGGGATSRRRVGRQRRFTGGGGGGSGAGGRGGVGGGGRGGRRRLGVGRGLDDQFQVRLLPHNVRLQLFRFDYHAKKTLCKRDNPRLRGSIRYAEKPNWIDHLVSIESPWKSWGEVKWTATANGPGGW